MQGDSRWWPITRLWRTKAGFNLKIWQYRQSDGNYPNESIFKMVTLFVIPEVDAAFVILNRMTHIFKVVLLKELYG